MTNRDAALTPMLRLPFGVLQGLHFGNEKRNERIRLRRFAGPREYTFGMTPLRIVHLTDLHVGVVTPWSVQLEAMERANAQNPDLIVITGDFVCHSQLYLDQLTDLTSRLRGPVVGVLGNHDYWAGADEVAHALDRGGVQLLRNQNTTITLRNQKLQIVGVDDAYTGNADKNAAVCGIDPKIPVLGLSHIAEEADGLWKRGVPLVLAGHTHGGQITVARLHEIAIGRLFGHKYVHGLYGSRHPDRNNPDSPHGAVYVSAGIGASVIPLRFGDRGHREIAIFELGAQPGAFDEHHAEQPALLGRKPSEKVQQRRAEQVEKNKIQREKRAARGGSPPRSP